MLAYLLAMLETDADKALFTEIVMQNQKMAYAICMKILCDHNYTEDAMMDGWVKMIKHFEDTKKYYYSSEPIFEPWLVRVMKNAAIDVWREKKRAPIPMETWDFPTADVEYADPESELRMTIDTIKSMPPQMRDLLEMRIAWDYSFKEIGKLLRCSAGAARKRYEKAKAELDKRIREK